MKNLQTQTNSRYSGLTELKNIEIMKNYNEFIVYTAIKNVPHFDTVVDFGAGIGTLSKIFKNKYQIDPICIEIDRENIRHLSEKKFLFHQKLDDIEGFVDLIFSSNVMEHIEDDISVLHNMAQKLSENGSIFLYIPAKMSLWSQLDENVGHYRRYEIKELRNKCKRVGLKINKIHYADSIGFFASLLMKIVGHNSEGGLGSKKSLQFYDRWIFPISSLFDLMGFKYLFGKNIVMIASKK
jgi:SAM-dependent methyltransferase